MNTTILAALGLTLFAAGAGTPTVDPSPLALNGNGDAKNAFPHREKYKECTPISTEDLADLDEVYLIDARNKAEFDVIHMAGSKNIVLEGMKLEHLLAVRAKEDAKPIVFYCNGHT